MHVHFTSHRPGIYSLFLISILGARDGIADTDDAVQIPSPIEALSGSDLPV
jgi:hypothetical protein